MTFSAHRSRVLALCAVLILGACGSDAPTAPRITALRLSPESGVRPGELLTVTVDLIDEDGDAAGGQAELGLQREGDTEGDLFRVNLKADGSFTKATIALDIRLPTGAIPGHYDLSVVILDAATRRSNPLVIEFDVLN